VVADRLALLSDAADAVARSLAGPIDRGLSGMRPGQYVLDVSADAAALEVLLGAGVGVLSEESGLQRNGSDLVVIIDPVDGSTNASRGVPWFATSLCLVDRDGPATALVVNLATGVRYWAERGAGAWSDGTRLRGSGCGRIGDAVIGMNGVPPSPLGSAQVRVLGAVALDLCAVAAGVLDGYVDCVVEAHGVWDHAAGSLICREAGVPVVDLWGRELVVVDHRARRTPVAGSTPAVLESLLRARRTSTEPPPADAIGSVLEQ
jgi:myo-inositol-1(or 4)-monophosphatase